jgi:MFS family permease
LTSSFSVWLAALAALSVALVASAVVMFGIGMGVAVAALTVLVAEAAPARLRGRATSLSASTTLVGQAASPLLLGPIVSATSITTRFRRRRRADRHDPGRRRPAPIRGHLVTRRARTPPSRRPR